MLPTLFGGVVSIVIAVVFLGVVLFKVPELPLLVVAVIGVACMVVSVYEAVRAGEDQFGEEGRY